MSISTATTLIGSSEIEQSETKTVIENAKMALTYCRTELGVPPFLCSHLIPSVQTAMNEAVFCSSSFTLSTLFAVATHSVLLTKDETPTDKETEEDETKDK